MKKLSILLIALALVACVGVYATVAYFTDTAQVTNTFTVGKVNITLDEERVDTSGARIPESTRTPVGNDYHLVPGHSYKKDPQITIKAGSEPCFVRMLVTFNHISDIEKMLPNTDFTNTMPFIVEEKISQNWNYYGSYTNTTADTRTYEYRYGTPTGGGDSDLKLPALFEVFAVPGELTKAQLDTLIDTATPDNSFKIEIVGHAIQAEGFGNDEDAAWNAFGSNPTGTLVTPAPTTEAPGGSQSGGEQPGTAPTPTPTPIVNPDNT